ncbi:MAG: amidohydrolase family protein [Phycisphaerales bacterium JB043]
MCETEHLGRNLLGPLAAILGVSLLSSVAYPASDEATPGGADTQQNESNDDDTKEWDVSDPPGDWGWRDVAIDTTSSTWSSLDVSPDGRTIAFDMLGDIYTMPITGGDATLIRGGIAWDMQPRFSPDGTRIAFTSDAGGGDNIWIMGSDGSDPRQVSEESFRLLNGPAWDPSGDFIVARKHFTSTRSLGAGEMWLYHVSGGSGHQMTKRPTEQKDVNEPVFSPDGRYLYYSLDATGGRTFQYNKDSTGQIYAIERYDRETGETERITGGAGGAARPAPSPDGRWLAFIRRVDYKTSLFIRDLESGNEILLTDTLERDNQEAWAIHGVYPTIAWTPDSGSILYWAKGGIHSIDIDSRVATDIPFRVRTTKKVATPVRSDQRVWDETFRPKMLRQVSVSPDGTRACFVTLGHVYVMDLPSSEPRRLTTFDDRFEHDPAWSRDGRSIVFGTWRDGELGELRVASADGGNGDVITPTPGHYIDPQFSPDGETVVFRKVGGGFLRSPLYSDEQGIYVVSADGGEMTRVRDGGTFPHFGASDDVIYFTTRDGDHTGDSRALNKIGIDGKDERELYKGKGIQTLRVSPDGEWLAFRQHFGAYITPLVETGKSISLGKGSKSVPVAKASKHAGWYLHFSGDSRTLHWSLGSRLYSRDLTESFTFLDGAGDEPSDPTDEGVDLSFEVQADAPSGTVAFVGARIVTMRGDEVIENGVLVVEGNTIAAVGSRERVSVPEGAHVVDATGRTIIPGLIDAHAHGAQGTQGVIPRHNWSQFANLAFGVTAIHDPSNDTETFFAASEMSRAGQIRTPRLFSTGTILYGAAGSDYRSEVDSLEDATYHLHRRKQVGAFSVKSYNQPRRDQRQQVLEAARQLDMLVVPEGGSTFMHNMTMVVDGHTCIEHNIPVEKAYDDVLQLWQATQVAYTPTLGVCYGGMSGEYYWYQHDNVWENEHLTTFVPKGIVEPRSRRRQKAPEGDYNHIRAAEVGKELADRGIYVNTGAHGQLAGLALHWEIWMFAQGGMSPLEAIRGATMNPARHLGWDHQIGSIESGKLADLVVLDDNPLENIRNTQSVSMVMVNGRLFDARTMDQIGNHPDSVGSDAFGDGPRSLGIGKWWGITESMISAHSQCVCRVHTHN